MNTNQRDRETRRILLEPEDMNIFQTAICFAVFHVGLMETDKQDRLYWPDVKVVWTALLSWVLLAIFVLVSATLFFLDFRIADGEFRLFQRSGAFLLLASTFVEVWSGIKFRYDQNVLDLAGSFPPSHELRSILSDSRNYASDRFIKINRQFTCIGWVTTFLGTVIWACGDVPYTYL